ncbi:Uncharacterised protein [uncultured archaeon]|nr:Uncharacterised protein [uncultured archaeon]
MKNLYIGTEREQIRRLSILGKYKFASTFICMPKIRITLEDSNVSAVAVLHEDLAPETCKEVQRVLPLEGNALHAKWGGNEIWTSMPKMKITKSENENIFASPGDIMIVRPAPDVFDFAVFYGKGWCFGPTGFTPGNHFATIVENLPEFAKACQNILQKGSQKIVIKVEK